MEHRSDCEQLIADLVENHFGIEKHLKGCTYLKEAIEIAVQNPIVSMMRSDCGMGATQKAWSI